MEFLEYPDILLKARSSRKYSLVRKMLRTIGLQRYIIESQYKNRFWHKDVSSRIDWMSLISSKDTRPLIRALTPKMGTPLAQMMLAYSIIRCNYPTLSCWLEVDDNNIPIVRFSDIDGENTVIPNNVDRTDLSINRRYIVDSQQCMKIEKINEASNDDMLLYRSTSIARYMGALWKFSRIREPILEMMKHGTDIVDIANEMQRSYRGDITLYSHTVTNVSRYAMWHRIAQVYNEILEELPSTRHIGIDIKKREFSYDINFIFQ